MRSFHPSEPRLVLQEDKNVGISQNFLRSVNGSRRMG